jgi:hypothetical protein
MMDYLNFKMNLEVNIMCKIKHWLGCKLLDIDDWFARRKIYFSMLSKDKENHVNFLCRWALKLL